MKKATQLLGLAFVLPAALVLAEASDAYPCRTRTTIQSTDGSTTLYYYTNISGQNTLLPVAYESHTEPFGFIGVAIEPLTVSRAQEINGNRGGFLPAVFSSRSTVPEVDGVLVVRTLDQGPAALSGLAEGDVILGVNGEMVSDVRRVQQLISSSPINSSIPVTLQRGNQVLSVTINTGDGRYLRPLMQ